MYDRRGVRRTPPGPRAGLSPPPPIAPAAGCFRVDLGLRLRDQPARGRLKSGKGVGNGSMTVCLPLASPADLDDEALEWLKRAYDENA